MLLVTRQQAERWLQAVTSARSILIHAPDFKMLADGRVPKLLCILLLQVLQLFYSGPICRAASAISNCPGQLSPFQA